MNYKHNIDKSIIPTVNIMGVEIAAIDMDWLMRFTEENYQKLSGDYICVSNVYTTVMSYDHKGYEDIQNGGILAIPDGGPLASVGRKRGAKGMKRTPGPSYMGEVLKLSVERGWKHYFYGSTQDTLDKLKKTLEINYPGLNIGGMYSPPFKPMSEDEDRTITEQINAISPDFIWVGLGAPKQERWMASHQGKVKGLMVGVGAAFDYYAGNIKRAPEWMQKTNLEWFYRLIQEPRRLMKRYMISNSKFILFAVWGGK